MLPKNRRLFRGRRDGALASLNTEDHSLERLHRLSTMIPPPPPPLFLSLCVTACLPGRFVSAMKEISIMADNEVDS